MIRKLVRTPICYIFIELIAAGGDALRSQRHVNDCRIPVLLGQQRSRGYIG